jgi:hypothetical protein
VSLLAQHGWGKGEKIQRALSSQDISGVILSPHDERLAEMTRYVGELAQHPRHPHIMVDPQVYVSLLQGANEGKLPEYPYYRRNLFLRDFSARNIQQFVREAIDFQRNLEVTHILSPTIIQESFSDRTSQVALSLAQESVDYWGGVRGEKRPLLISVVFSENALSSHDQVAEFLDTISLYETHGFYLVVDRNDTVYSQDFYPARLSEFLKILYSLSRSRFELICGYSDFLGHLYTAFGASGVATGWSQRLRRFNSSKFIPSAGGRQPRDRYSSAPLLNSIFVTELDACRDARLLPDVLSSTPYDKVFNANSYPSGISWSQGTAALHHWATLAALQKPFSGKQVPDRLQVVDRTITRAQTLYAQLARSGVTFEPQNGPNHLVSWAGALANAKSSLRI